MPNKLKVPPNAGVDISRRTAFQLAITATVALTSPHIYAASGAKTINWSFMHHLPATHPVAKLYSAFVSEVLKATNGRLRIKLYALGELPFEESQTLEAFQTGTVQMAEGLQGSLAPQLPALGLSGEPFLATNHEETMIMVKTMEPYLRKQLSPFGVELLTVLDKGYQSFFGNGAPMSSPGDLKGRRVRTAGRQIAEVVTLFGGQAMQIPLGDVPSALGTGVVHTYITTPVSALGQGWGDFTTWTYVANIAPAPIFLLVSQGALAALPADVKASLLSVTDTFTVQASKQLLADHENALHALQKNAKTNTTATDAQLAEFVAKCKPAWLQWGKEHKLEELVNMVANQLHK
ncbi:MAG: hypothetical protein EPN34_06280 [Burkholderiaceae bacterium]|nr:MAG: hypothetical protein EPN34_06280 [Burkholderiaceae bacterium]